MSHDIHLNKKWLLRTAIKQTRIAISDYQNKRLLLSLNCRICEVHYVKSFMICVVFLVHFVISFGEKNCSQNAKCADERIERRIFCRMCKFLTQVVLVCSCQTNPTAFSTVNRPPLQEIITVENQMNEDKTIKHIVVGDYNAIIISDWFADFCMRPKRREMQNPCNGFHFCIYTNTSISHAHLLLWCVAHWKPLLQHCSCVNLLIECMNGREKHSSVSAHRCQQCETKCGRHSL